MSSYVLVQDVCGHEDYPCCGCSLDPYAMPESDARRLERAHKVKIIRNFDLVLDCPEDY